MEYSWDSRASKLKSRACDRVRRRSPSRPLSQAGTIGGRAMEYWACAQLEPNRTALALHCRGLAGFETYEPRLREQRRRHGRKIVVTPPLFPGYAFVLIVSGWWNARW